MYELELLLSKQKIAQKCIWKRVMNDSSQGDGTSYNMAQLSGFQTRCLECTGFNRDCAIYVPFN